MRVPRAALEDWLRDSYFDAEVDISSSGVAPYSVAEFRAITGLELAELDALAFRDSRSLGDPRLRAAIAGRWGDGDPERVMAANGSSEALFLVLSTLLRPGDEVVVQEPAYHSLVSIAGAMGCQVRAWPLRFEDGFRPDLDELEALLSGRTRMVVVNFPHNPTGVSLDADAAARLVDLVAGTGAYLLWDAAFADLSYDRPPLPDASTRYERAITFGTLSKAFGLPGLRVGWCFAPPDVLDGCVQLRDYTTLALSPVVELFALHAVRHADVLLAPRLAQARESRDVLREWVHGHDDRVAWVRPDGGVTAFPLLRGVPDVERFCDRLMGEHRVLLVPGTCFGRPGHVRLGFGVRPDELSAGLDAVSRLLGQRSAD
jgi:capreomycidine synthase